jgi:RNA polymerase sigma-70 factor (ECF subfamily)
MSYRAGGRKVDVVDEDAFAGLVERYRGELRVHCYRMLGSFTEAEDLVQETFLRAWKNFGGFEGRSTVRTWLYRIATNACLDALAGQARRVMPDQLSGPSDTTVALAARDDVPWLQPFPDRLWEPVAPGAAEPHTAAVDRETLELAFMAAIQHLSPRQRAVFILRDVLGWSARQTADLLASSVASVNSASQRARSTMREHLSAQRLEWTRAAEPTEREQAVLRRYMDAMERADLDAVAGLLAEDVRTMMPPWPMWFVGRDAMVSALATSWDPDSPAYVGRFRTLPTRANHWPAVATYRRGPGETAYHPFAISLLRIDGDRVTDAIAFHDLRLFPAFALPMTVR